LPAALFLVLKARPSWVKLKLHEWKRLRGFSVRVLLGQTSKKEKEKKTGEFSSQVDLKLGPQMHLRVPSPSLKGPYNRYQNFERILSYKISPAMYHYTHIF